MHLFSQWLLQLYEVHSSILSAELVPVDTCCTLASWPRVQHISDWCDRDASSSNGRIRSSVEYDQHCGFGPKRDLSNERISSHDLSPCKGRRYRLRLSTFCYTITRYVKNINLQELYLPTRIIELERSPIWFARCKDQHTQTTSSPLCIPGSR